MPIYEQLTGCENHQKRDKIRQKRARERLNFSSLYNEADIAIWNVSSGSSRNEWRYVGAESLMSSVCVCLCVCVCVCASHIPTPHYTDQNPF